MEPTPAALPFDLPLPDAVQALLASGLPALPVVRHGELLGVVTARAVSEALADDYEAASVTLEQLARLPAAVAPEASLTDALVALETADATGIPVIDDHGVLTGWLTHQRLLRAVAPTGQATSAAVASDNLPSQHGPDQQPPPTHGLPRPEPPTTPST